jgi:hypothetical protein
VISNTAGDDGGGAYLDYTYEGSGIVNFDDSLFRGNTAASDGGGFYFYECSEGCEFSLSGSVFENNRAAASDGGGMYFYQAQYGADMQLDNNDFISNTAGSDGGGLYYEYCTNGCELSISGNRFISNTAQIDYGGGLHFYEAYYGAIVHVDDNEFINNTSGGYGGGFYNDYFAYEGARGSFDRNILTGNTAGDDGGGFHSYGFGYDGADVSFSDNIVTSNTANGEGGGVYMYYPAYQGITLAFNRNVITGNTSTEDGGGLYFEEVEYGSRVEFRDNIISNNTISSTTGYDGGGIYMYDIDEGSIMWMTGNQINDNVATGDGGGLYMDDLIDYGSVWYFEGNELQRNWAGSDGGGCYFEDTWDDGSVIHFNRNLINDNVALGEAGGCYFYDIEYSEVNLIGNQFNRNTAGGDYGALFFDSVYDGSVMRFWGNQVIGNRAGIVETEFVAGQVVPTTTHVLGADYGGIYMEDITDGGEVDFRRSLILSNTAYVTYTAGITPVNGNFGGMYADLDSNGLLTMVDNSISGNAAQKDHGGLYIHLDGGSRVVLEHNLIQANTAITNGAGLYIEGDADSQYFLERNRVLDNSAGQSSGGIALISTDNTAPIQPLWGWSVNNLVADNGGGSALEIGVLIQNADFRSLNDTIANNTGYGIFMTGTITSTAYAYVSNTILWGHSASFSKTQVITYTDRFTMTADYSDVQYGWPGIGNLNTNPLFVGSGDYHLQQSSPVREQAHTASAPVTDLDGVPRPVPAGGDADMGCYEWRLPGVDLGPDQASTELPGAVVTYTLTITNEGNAGDTFLLDVFTNTLGWALTVSPASVSLNPGANATVDVQVTVPANAPGGTLNHVIVRATSQTDGAIVAAAALDTTAANVAAVGLSPDRDAFVIPGLVMRYEHTLANDGNFDDDIQLSAGSSQGWAIAVQPTVASVPSSGTMTIVVSVTVPGDALASTIDTATITATSSATHGTITANVTDSSTVLQFARASIAPDHAGFTSPGATITYTHVVSNTGNGSDTLDLVVTSSQGWTVTVTPGTVPLAAGASSTIQVAVVVPASAGDATDVATVTATSRFNDTVSASAQDTTRTQSRIYLPLVVRLYVTP